ncbi:MAG TPA: hypothetical protein VGL72_31450 [Bryobacteraceae bacterium]|jgi:hypothetical protein
MKRLLSLIGASVLLVAPFRAQTPGAQTENDLTLPELQGVLQDLGSYLDSHKGTNFRSQFQAIPDEVLRRLSPAIKNPRQLKTAVTALKETDAAVAGKRVDAIPTLGATTLGPDATFPSCPPNTIIDTSASATCTPSYPDSTNSAWRAMTGAMIPVGNFSGVPAEIPTASDYAAASKEGCDLTHEVNLEQVQASLNGIVDVGQFICAALVPPDPLAIACYIAAAAIGAAGETDAGLYTDCLEQDGLVNAAEIDAGFHNTVTIYNALTGAQADIDTRINNLGTQITNVDTQITGEFNTAATQLTNVNTQITGEFSTAATQLTNVNTQITGEFNTLSTQLTALINALSKQVGQEAALSDAELRQVMKLLLEPDGLKAINPAVLTCNGINCPNVLANCPTAGCSWNSVGSLP